MLITIHVPNIVRGFTGSATFLKKIPIRLVVLPQDLKNITDYMNRQKDSMSYQSGQTAIYGDPYKDTGDYSGIKTDIRYYNTYNPTNNSSGQGSWNF